MRKGRFRITISMAILPVGRASRTASGMPGTKDAGRLARQLSPVPRMAPPPLGRLIAGDALAKVWAADTGWLPVRSFGRLPASTRFAGLMLPTAAPFAVWGTGLQPSRAPVPYPALTLGAAENILCLQF